MSEHKNFVKMTVSGTPGTGTITLGSAVSGYQSLASAYGANATVDVSITEGTAWEVARDCTYTNSGTTLTRGTFEASSTGSAISFTSAAVVTVTATADFGRRMESAALNHVAGADAATTMAVGSLYVVDGATLTADRTYTLPATAAVGDRIGVMLSAGSASYAVLLTAASGDTLNGVSGGTEWSRLFIAGETVVMRCVTANSTWIVENDSRLFESCRIDTNGTTATHTRNAATKISAELATETLDANEIWDATNKRLIPRRLGRYIMHGHLQMASMQADKPCVAQIYKNGSTNVGGGGTCFTVAAASFPEADVSLVVDVTTLGDYYELFVYYEDSATNRSTNSVNVYFEATRIGGSA